MPDEENKPPAEEASQPPECGGCPSCPHGQGTPPAEPQEPEASEAAEPAGEPVAEVPAAGEAVAAPAPRPRRPRPGWLCTALHGKMSRVDYFSAPSEAGFPHGCKVLVRTERGTEMACIVASPRRADLAELKKRPGEVLRAASAEDLDRQRSIEQDIESTELKECSGEISKHKLPMKLAAAEHLFGGEKIVFYFMSEGRVDFRKLVREMSRKYRTRIEFRQIGVRDEARLLAEYEHCGQPLCCRQFLRGLEPVTMRMAKLQKATLDPAKISGRCGRLMCCLRYEEEVYAHLRTKLPPRGAYILTDELAGQVVSGDIISQQVTVRSGIKSVNVKVDDIKEISREPLEAPVKEIPLTPVKRPPRPRSRPRPSTDTPKKKETRREEKPAGRAAGGKDGQQSSSGRSRRPRRRGKRSRSRGGRGGGGAGGGSASGGTGGGSGGKA